MREPLQPGRSELPRRASGPDLPYRAAQPGRSELPRRASGADLPSRAAQPGRSELPQRASGPDLPYRAAQPAGTGPAAGPAGSLPKRTGRTRRAGRHRSPHRLSVASDAPALVLATPGSAAADTAGIGQAVAAMAGLSCPGVDVRVGYLEGDTDTLAGQLDPPADAGQPVCVVVPLLLSPNARSDAALARIAAAHPHVIVAAHLAPHPLVAEGLHARLAESGLARHARSSGLFIATGNRGVVVLSDVGEEAASAAGVACVLLASRLSVPAVPASLGDPASIAAAVSQLRMSGAASPVLAPCLIGPEVSRHVLDGLATAVGAPMSVPLGAHQVVGQLVAIRYGAALARMSMAG